MLKIDIAGQRYGRLTALKFSRRDKEKGRTYWSFSCDCGNTKDAVLSDVRKGCINSCGCLRREISAEKGRQKIRMTHGLAHTRFNTIYLKIKDRCNKTTDQAYKNYGGRGIKCLWNTFEEFRDDMHESYLKHCEEFGVQSTEIDRINNNGPYYKENCQWTTPRQNARNRRSNLVFVIKGEKKCLIEWTEKYNMGYIKVYKRLKRGWPIEEALKV